MLLLKPLCLSVLGVAAVSIPARDLTQTLRTISARDITAIQNALTTVDNDLKDLTTKTKAWDGSTAGAIPVQQAAKKLNDDIDSATTTCTNSAAATSTESQTIINYVNNTLVPDAKAAVDALIAAKPKFQNNASLYKVAKDRCASLKTSTTNLADCLISKASSDKKSAAQTAKSNILAQIQRCVDAFP